MPEYLAPGVYVEETSFRSKSIEGVSTTTTGFVGPARYGPVTLEPDILTGLLDFERVFGDRRQLIWSGGEFHNYLWHGVRAFFEEGGKRLYVARVFLPLADADGDASRAKYLPAPATLPADVAQPVSGVYRTDGHARRWLTQKTTAVASAERAVRALDNALPGVRVAAEKALKDAQAAAIAAAADPKTSEQQLVETANVAARSSTAAKEAVHVLDAPLKAVTDAAAAAKTAYPASTIVPAAVQASLAVAKDRFTNAAQETLPSGVLAIAAEQLVTAALAAVEALNAASGKADTAAALVGQSAFLTLLTKALADTLKADGTARKATDDAKTKADDAKVKADEAKAAPADNAKRAAAEAAASAALAASRAVLKATQEAAQAGARAVLQAVADNYTPADRPKISDAATATEALHSKVEMLVQQAVAGFAPRAVAAQSALDALTDLEKAAVELVTASVATTNQAQADAPSSDHKDAVLLRARFPGAYGNLSLRFVLNFGLNTLVKNGNQRAVRGLGLGDALWIGGKSTGAQGKLLIAGSSEEDGDWFFSADGTKDKAEYWLNQPQAPRADKPRIDEDLQIIRPVTVGVEVTFPDGSLQVWDGLALQPAHRRAGADDSLAGKFTALPASATDARTLPFVLLADASVSNGVALYKTLFGTVNEDLSVPAQGRLSCTHLLGGGNDGQRPGAAEFEGVVADTYKTGLKALADLEDISIVAAPGSTFGLENGYGRDAKAILSLLLGHAQDMRYCIAVLDAGNAQSISQIRALRAQYDSKYAALYYPWVRILDPVTRGEITLPPSGFVAGIYARNDIQRAVYKAPANEVVNLAIGFEQTLNKAQQEVLNPEGINCFRYFEGRGFRLWGARTISSDPEWKYVNLRRYFAYLERSIDKGTQWAVFEPNGEALWANVRRTIEDFLLNEWQSGALLGDKPEKAFFVKCDRSTMTQNDLDNGRIICLIGVAPLRPAEFVIFRIGQWTADRKV